MAIMTVYHGGYQAVEKPEIRKGRNTKGFWNWFLLYDYKMNRLKDGPGDMIRRLYLSMMCV